MFQSEPGFKALRPKVYAGSINLCQRRAWYEGDPAPAPDPNVTPPPATPPAPNGGTPGATFTQADVDRIVGERATRAAETATAKLLKELGFEKVDDLKTTVTSARERADAEKTELQKLQERLDATEKKRTEAEDRAKSLEALRLTDARDSAIRAALKDADKPDDLLLLIHARMKDDVTNVMADDGALDAKAIDALAEKARKEWPSSFKSAAPGSQSHTDGRTPEGKAAQTKQAQEHSFRSKRRTV